MKQKETNVSKESRLQAAVQAAWERSYHEYLGWPEARRAAAEPAARVLVESLRRWTQPVALEIYYWRPGDLLQQHLPDGFDAEEQLTIEDACFWRRLLEIRADA